MGVTTCGNFCFYFRFYINSRSETWHKWRLKLGETHITARNSLEDPNCSSFFTNLTIKSRTWYHITASFTKMVSLSYLILSDHVTISLLPFKIWLSSSSINLLIFDKSNKWRFGWNKPTSCLTFFCVLSVLLSFCLFSLRFHLIVEMCKWGSCFKGT